MKLEYRYSFAEFMAIIEGRNRQKLFPAIRDIIYWAMAAFCVSFGLSMYLNFSALNFKASSAVPLIGFGLFMIAWRLFLLPSIYRSNYKQYELDDVEIKLLLNNAGVELNSKKTEIKHGWSDIVKASEEPNHFLLWINKLQAYSIPKSCIGNDAKIKEFKAMVGEKITDRDFSQ